MLIYFLLVSGGIGGLETLFVKVMNQSIYFKWYMRWRDLILLFLPVSLVWLWPTSHLNGFIGSPTEFSEFLVYVLFFVMWFLLGIIWPHVLRWFRIFIVLPYDIRMHVLRFGGLHLFRKWHFLLHPSDMVNMYFDYLKWA